ncbi:NADPH oxidase [Verticillium alfalfae VaMs.102]|uniref:NADPH oxidase n=1 Tax=Verticillium alfalfae (strain VaMs.102 / ATCC MYA-4576 / FGSC 10136) TaxID=526221 RepID=C9SLQ2_VERA1|nr:NADPH oxidase [Verticillium alfalfae VaMs.102]EEY19620.1 NADPH oxidase [Verticillium alfalfae VaMs.102]
MSSSGAYIGVSLRMDGAFLSEQHECTAAVS